MNQKEKETTHSISIVMRFSQTEKYEVNTELYTSLFEWLRENNCYIKYVTTEYKDGRKENNMIVLGIDFFEFLKFLTIK